MSAPGKDAARAHVLVVEDSSVFREMQTLLLGQAGYAVSAHENPNDALAAAGKRRFDLVVIDYELPQMNGEQFMHALRKLQPDVEVVFVSGSLTVELAIKLSRQGVAGIFNKPTNPKTLLEKIDETLARHAARDTNARIGSRSPLATSRTEAPFASAAAAPTADRLAYPPRYVLGKSDTFREFTHRLWKVRDFRAVLLLQGEPGSPFELIARELAEISVFRDGPIMLCDAAEFEPRRLIEVLAPSLLSHDAGTLVLTGVEMFTAEQQKTLANLLSARDVFLPFARRFRVVVAATSALAELVDGGSFDETLYYKVSSVIVAVPSLREMRGDIVTNAQRILAANREAGHPQTPRVIASDAMQWIETQDWPGNYQELAQTILRAVPFADGDELTLEAIAASWPAVDEAPAVVATAPQFSDLGELTERDAPPPPVFADTTPLPRPVGPAAMQNAPEAAPARVESAAAAIARVPAGQLFARASAAPTSGLTAQSLFRPASSNYSFAKRLAESLAAAEAH